MNSYSEGDKMLLASFIMMDILALQAENDIRKAEGRQMKYDQQDFYKAVKYAHQRLRDY